MEAEIYIILLVAAILIVAIFALVAIFRVVAKIYPYAYINARIRAMHARLIKKEDFEELLEKPYNEIVYTLDKRYFPHLATFLDSDFWFNGLLHF